MCIANKEFQAKRALRRRNSLAPRDFVVRSFALVDITKFVHSPVSAAPRAQRQLPLPCPGHRNVRKMNWMPSLAALALQPLPMLPICLTSRRWSKNPYRWRPALPLGTPHTTTEDDWYEGMFIPKGTLCMVNLWQCQHDPASYGPDAASFNLERFLGEHGKPIPGPVEMHNDGHSTYGFGRWACVGKHSANDSLFIDIATVLWAAQLEPAHDETGKEIPIDADTPVDIGTVL